MKPNPSLLLIASLILSACATPSASLKHDAVAVSQEPPKQLPHESTEPNIPYPTLNEQDQIDHLGRQIARLEHEIQLLHSRVQQLEQHNNIRPPQKVPNHSLKTAPAVQRLSDSKLKNMYLANSKQESSEAQATFIANESELYNQAAKYYRRGNYAAAAALLKEADGGNGNEQARRNMYLLLQSQQRLGHCESVIEVGNRYANRFRGTTQAPEALFSIAQCQYKMQQKDIARVTWRKLIQTYPESAAAKRAVLQLKQR